MDVDEDDDFYAPEDSAPTNTEQQQSETALQSDAKPKQEDDDLEEGEEEDGAASEGSDDSDIDIITEKKDGSKSAPTTQPRYNEIRNIPQRNTANDTTVKALPVKKEVKDTTLGSSVELPGISTSKIDVDAKPIYEPVGKPITQVNIDEDLTENDKPWRRPGTDVSDYFNYGFDEFTWALYASKQETLRSEYNEDKVAQNNKKMFEDMNMMMAMGGFPGMPGMPSTAGGAQMPTMEGMPPEMQAMMQQMMASGMDPSQMDPSTMFAGMQANQSNAGGAAAAQGGSQGQGFGGGQGNFGQGQNQAAGYNFEQGNNRGGGNFGRGRGGRRNW